MSRLRVLHLCAEDSVSALPAVPLPDGSKQEFSVVSVDTSEAARTEHEQQQIDALVIEPPVAADIIQLIEEFHDRDPKLPILLFAVSDSIEISSEVLASGGEFVPKSGDETQYERLASWIQTSADGPIDEESNPWRQSTSALSQLYSVTNQAELEFTEKLNRALDIGAHELGYPIGYATRIDGRSLELLAISGEHDEMQVGMTSELSDNYCQLTIDADEPVGIGDASVNEALAELSAYSELGLQCYVGAPIRVEGEVYGSLCFAGTESRDPELIEAQKLTVKTLAQWVGYELERSQREEELQRQIDRLEEFSNIVSHDLRNPLNVAQGRLDLAQAECESPHLDTVIDAIDRMEEIIEDTLTLAKQGQSVDEMNPIEIKPLLEDCWDVIESDEAELRVVDDFTVHGDRNRLSHIFENLFRNAIEHSQGPVTIRVGLLNVMYTSTRADTGGTFGFFVEDDGPGIPEGRRESVFDAGETTRKDGTGFGLSIVKQIAEAHGWEIDLSESFDGGARFEFSNVR